MRQSAFQPVLRKRGELTVLERHLVPPHRRQPISCARGTGDTGLRLRRRGIDGGVPALGTGLAGAWQRLGAATSSARTLADLLWVLEATVCVIPAVVPVADCRCGPSDVRHCLDDPESVRTLLAGFARLRPEALRLLRREGRDLRSLAAEPIFPTVLSGPGGITPRAADGLLPWLKGTCPTPAVVAAWELLVHGAEADREAMLSIMLEKGGADWLPLVAAQPGADRMAILRRLADSPAGAQAPPQGTCALFRTLEHLPGKTTWTRRLNWVLTGLAAGALPGWLSACLRWHARHRKDPPEVRGAAVHPSRRALHLVMRRGCACLRREPEKVWKLLAGDPVAEPVLRRIFAEGSRLPRWQQDLSCVFAGTRRGGWKRDQFLKLLPQLMAVVTNMREASRYDCWNLLDEWIVRSPAAFAGPEDELLYWLRRFAAGGPALPYKGLRFMALCLAGLDPGSRLVLRGWTEDDLKVFQRRSGEYSFPADFRKCLQVPGLPKRFLVRALRRHLRLMLDLLPALAGLPEAAVRRVWQAMAEHPLCACDAAATAPAAALVLLDAVAAGYEKIPGLPDSVRRLIAAGLPDESVRWIEARSLLEARWARLSVAVFARLIEWEIYRQFPGTDDRLVDGHTLRMALHNREREDNARPYRRIVRACSAAQGTRNWARRLAQNTAWLAKHPVARHPAWEEGWAVRVGLGASGPVQLELEEDLQEILRMGTRFRTCLSVGAFNSHSAAAVALDANKRLLVARDAKGKVIARQLLALSEEGLLVCFPVYALRDRIALRSAFVCYDLMLAHCLGIPVWQSEEDYTVAALVCPHWYDDGAWLFCRDEILTVS